LDTRGERPEEFETYFRQQPPNSVAVFFRSSAADHNDLSKKFQDMLIRANQIVHLRRLVNFEDIPELVISTNEKPWPLENDLQFNMLWIGE